MAATDIEDGEVGGCLWVIGVVDNEVEEHEKRGERSADEDPVWN